MATVDFPGKGPESRHIGGRAITDADYRTMIDAVTDYAIFMLDPNGVVRSWNEGARRIKGYENHEVIGKHVSMFYPQELNDSNWADYELSEARKEGRFECEGWRLRKNGSRFWANIVISPILSADGSVSGYAKITRDLTERRKQEDLLRSSEERFRMLVASVQDYAIFMLDPSGYIVSWNAGGEKNTGYRQEEIIGKHISMFYPEGTAPTTWEHESKAALSDGSFTDECWRLRKDGTRFWAGVTLTPVYDNDRRLRGYAKITRDLTQVQKMSALQDESRRINNFLAMLGHELRNPLAPIANSLSLLRRQKVDETMAQSSYAVMERQLKHMTRLIDDLLDVSRISSGKIRLEKKPVHLQEAILVAVEAIQPTINAKRHRLALKTTHRELWVNGDRARIIQIVANLLGNAAKFTPEGGLLELELAARPQGAEISVRDNGPGIPESLRDHIFDMFVQGSQDVARTAGGLGLGLSLTRQLCVLHGGNVEVYSKGVAGAGSEFRVILPAIAPPADAAADAPEKQGMRVLIVDDNQDAADSMSMLLQLEGLTTAVSYSGDTALEIATSFQPDAVLLDIGLPGVSGLEVAKRMRAELRKVPEIVACTGYGQDSDREMTFKAGFFAHLTKPVDTEQVLKLLKRIKP